MDTTEEMVLVAELLDKTATAHKRIMTFVPDYEEALCTLFSINDKIEPFDITGMVMPELTADKDAAMMILRAKLKHDQAWAYLFIAESWMVEYSKDVKYEDITVRPRDDDRRVECFTMYYESKSGFTQFRNYLIKRKPAPDLVLEERGTEKVNTRWSGLLESGLMAKENS